MKQKQKQKPDLGMHACACGCGARLSTADLAREQWLSDIAGPPGGMRVNLAPSVASDQRRHAAEPTTELICASCGVAFELEVWLAEFLDTWGMERPRCEGCNNRRRDRAADGLRRTA